MKIKGNAPVVVSTCYYLVRTTSMSKDFGKQRICGELRGSKQVASRVRSAPTKLVTLNSAPHRSVRMQTSNKRDAVLHLDKELVQKTKECALNLI